MHLKKKNRIMSLIHLFHFTKANQLMTELGRCLEDFSTWERDSFVKYCGGM